ncbi:MAG: diaminopimelate epimerase [Planctomycetales bacterium]|nr:diaminopimelate epimerase [Planctomycetales bacterium]
MKFTKIHGLGNDYLFVEALEREPRDPAGLARAMSHRRLGAGADGLILVCRSAIADFRMRIWNADGSEAEMCGNGLRGFAQYVHERGLTKKETLAVETGAGVLEVKLFREGGRVSKVRVDLGEPRLERRQIPMEGPPGRVVSEKLRADGETLEVTAVSMGNPHCVVFVPDVAAAPVESLGPRIERHAAFPRRTNVEFAQPLSRAEVRQRTWERGAGETWACGTGAAAVCVAGVLTNRTDRAVRIHLVGGDLELEWSAGTNHVLLTGPTAEVYRGEWPDPDR